MSGLVEVTFIGWFKSGEMFTNDLMLTGEHDEIRWATTQFAEINKALVKAFVNDQKVCEVDFRG